MFLRFGSNREDNMVETNKDAIARKFSEVEIIDMPQEELNWAVLVCRKF